MTVEEFESQKGSIRCHYCGSTSLATRPNITHVELYCEDCGRHQRFLGQGKRPDARPKLKSGTLDEVWAGSQGHCAHCGLSSEVLDALGLHRTVQHVPPFIVNGHEGYLIPLCNWCQQDSASQMKRLTSMVERLSKKFDVRGTDG